MMEPSPGLRTLIDEARNGSREAFAELVAPYTQRVQALLRGLLGEHLKRMVDSEDLSQETFLRAWRSFRQFRGDNADSLWSWLKTISEHVVKDQARRQKVRSAILGTPISPPARDSSDSGGGGNLAAFLPAKDPNSSTVLRRKERFERFEQALSTLSPDHHKVILLARVQGLAIKEVAKIMRRSPKAVSMLLLRAGLELKRTFHTTGSFSLPADARLREEPSVGDEERPPNGSDDRREDTAD